MGERAMPEQFPATVEEQFNRGRNLIYGYGVEPDIAKGAHWLEQAAAQNFARAFIELGCMHFHGRHYPADQQRGLELVRRALSLGHTDALNTLGILYSLKEFPTFDMAIARDYFRQAAEADDYYGLFNHALELEMEGRYAEAVKWYRRAVEQSHDTAHYRLAGLLADGKGVPQDIEEACRLYDFAGDELQYPLGYFGYARLHDDPKYGRQDLETAAGFYFLAADKGIAQAQLRYAELAELGYGDPDNPYDPYVWTRVAMEHLEEEDMARAQATLERIKSKLSTEQLAEAEAEALSTIDFLRPFGRC
ncbi:MAG: sel1 repeat family protein [Rhodospirillaceae bacterium]|nr:sel1 repeat family protein [Rhodospirillaceae bacterium]